MVVVVVVESYTTSFPLHYVKNDDLFIQFQGHIVVDIPSSKQ